MRKNIDETLKQVCNKCLMKGACAWLSFDNEYCPEILELDENIKESIAKRNERNKNNPWR